MEFVDKNDEILQSTNLTGLTYEECRQIQLEFATESRRLKQKEELGATEKTAGSAPSLSEPGLIRTLIRESFMPEDGLLMILFFPVRLIFLIQENRKRFTSKKQMFGALSLCLLVWILWGILFLLASLTTIYFLMKISFEPEIFNSIQAETLKGVLLISGLAAMELFFILLVVGIALLFSANKIIQKDKPDRNDHQTPEEDQPEDSYTKE